MATMQEIAAKHKLKKPVPTLTGIQEIHHKKKIAQFNAHASPFQCAPSNAFRNNFDGIKWDVETEYSKRVKLKPKPYRDEDMWSPFRCEF